MIKDKFGNSIYEEKDLIELFYKDYNSFSEVIVDSFDKHRQFEELTGTKLNFVNPELENLSLEEFDKACQTDWFIPEEYKNMDIEGLLVHVCPKENYQRLIEELQEYRDRNLLPLLRTLKYLIDTLRSNNIVWGVGRGSSVASYVLFLLDVHKIDSIKYNLDWREFLR
jgi:DNA polymerase III alpha subunit